MKKRARPMHHVVEIEIVRFVDEHQPGWVECALKDAHGRVFTFVEKVPIVTVADLWPDSTYPQTGELACTIVGRRVGPDGRELVTVDSELPWGIEATTGEARFEVEAERVRESSW